MRTHGRIGAFISAAILTVVAGGLFYGCYEFGNSLQAQEGLEVLSQIITMPWLIGMYIVLAAVLFSAMVSALVAGSSCYPVIQVIASILMLCCMVMTGFAVYNFLQLGVLA